MVFKEKQKPLKSAHVCAGSPTFKNTLLSTLLTSGRSAGSLSSTIAHPCWL